MIFCNHCGKENKDAAKFCVACGNKITVTAQPAESPAQETQENELVCSQCGKHNKPHAKFCVQCGNSLVFTAKQEQQPSYATQEILADGLVCTQCGKLNKPSDKFCVACGNRLGAPIPQQEEREQPVSIQEPIVQHQQDPVPVVENIAAKETIPVAETVDTSEKVKEEEIQVTASIHEESPVIEEMVKDMHQDRPIEEEISATVDEPVPENIPEEKEIPAVVASLYERIALEKKLREAAAKGEKQAAESYTPPKTYQPDYGTSYVDDSIAKEKISPVTEDSGSDMYIHRIRPAVMRNDDDEELAPIPIIRNNNDAERRRKRIIFLTLGLLVLAVLGVGGYYLLQNGKDKNSSELQNVLNNTPVRGTDSATPGGGTLSNGGHDSASSISGTDRVTKIDTTAVVPIKPDKFKYLSIGQIKSDMVGKELCEGLEYSGSGQTLNLIGFFPNQDFQKNLIENGAVIVNVSFKDNTENKSCTIEVVYRKQGNKFSFDNYAQK